MSTIKIGELISNEEKQERDAIHIAVAPVIAGQRLHPGEHIGFIKDDGEIVGLMQDSIGIVDPFLKKEVQQGERFWMFLYPNTITSLRHDWTHPAFERKEEESPQEATEKIIAKRWITNWAAQYGMTYDDAIRSGMSQDFFLGEVCNDLVPEFFWYNFKIITGRDVTEETKKNTYFHCAC